MKYMRKICIKFFLLFIIGNSIVIKAQTLDSILKHIPHFELSFGQSLLFISDGKLADIRKQTSVIVPTNAFLFFVEFRPEKRIKIPAFLNLPTETKQYIVNGQIINDRASPTIGTGIEFKVFQVGIDDRSTLSGEIGPLASIIFDKKYNIKVAPIIAGRLRVKRGENFVMYFGLSYSLGINALGILYGTGTVF